MENSLGKLEKIELRDVWSHEALDFTKWLSKKENLILLGDEVGIDIDTDSVKTEAKTGDFNLDILAEEENTGKKIIIENQFGATNHDHLGKIITYASGHDAKTIIWIVEKARDEHEQAINWLNEHTDEDTNFFLIQIELWRIGSSLPAPKFYIISQPNDWAKEVKKSLEPIELTEIKKLQLEFWNKFSAFLEINKSSLRAREAKAHHWYDAAIGSSRAHLSFTVNTQENLVGVGIYIGDDKELYNSLKLYKEEIEKELEAVLEWMDLPTKKASRIKLVSHIDITSKETWEDAFAWFQSWGEKFQKVFFKHIKEVGRDSE